MARLPMTDLSLPDPTLPDPTLPDLSGPALFGRLADGAPVHRLVIGNAGLRVALIEFGAAVQAIRVAGAGGWVNVALGLSTLEEYVALSPHLGAVPGRYAGRIAGGRFALEGVVHRLPRNNGGNTLHGGPTGFGKRAWTLTEHGPGHATMALDSADGEAGFPGALWVEVRYVVEDTELRIDFRATTTRPTVLNLTNHSYFNLAGEGSGSVLGHELTIDGDEFTPLDAESLPTGEIRAVAGTPLDFRTPHAIGARIRTADPQIVMARGYDHAFLIRGAGLRRAALLREPASGRTLEVLTTEPALQFYTANMLTGSLAGLSGRTYRQGDAVCLEAQHLADSPNQPHFPSTVLRPGETYSATTIFRFGLA